MYLARDCGWVLICKAIILTDIIGAVSLLCRNRILADIDRFIHAEQVINRVVYCLNNLVSSTEDSRYTDEQTPLGNFDEDKCVTVVQLMRH